MKKIWPILILLIVIFGAFYAWIKVDSYDPYGIDEIDKMLEQDPPWSEEKTKDKKLVTKSEVKSTIQPTIKTEEKKDAKNIIMNSDKLVPGPSNEIAKEITLKMNEDDYDRLELEVENAEKIWLFQVTEMFQNELNLSSEIINRYERLRSEYYIEKEKAVQEFNDKMISKYGDDYLTKPTKDMPEYQNTVFDNYLERLRMLLGDESYSRYLEIKHHFNKDLLKKQDPQKGIFEIEI